MILHYEFIKKAKKLGNKIAIKDRTLNREVSYSKALIGSLILSNKFKKYEDGDIGVMVPTSAGCVLAVIGILMAGKVPVMINYSTGAAKNCKYAQKKCGFKTIITARQDQMSYGPRYGLSRRYYERDFAQRKTQLCHQIKTPCISHHCPSSKKVTG